MNITSNQAPSAAGAIQASGGESSQDGAVARSGMTAEQQKAVDDFNNYKKYQYKEKNSDRATIDTLEKNGQISQETASRYRGYVDQGADIGFTEDKIYVISAPAQKGSEFNADGTLKKSTVNIKLPSDTISKGPRHIGDLTVSAEDYDALHPLESSQPKAELSGSAAIHYQSLQRQESLKSQGEYFEAYSEKVSDKKLQEVLTGHGGTINPGSQKVTLTEELRTDPLIGDSFTLLQSSLFTAEGELSPLPLIGNSDDLQKAYSDRIKDYEKLEGGDTGRVNQAKVGALDIALTVLGGAGGAVKSGALMIPKVVKNIGKTAATIEGVGTLANIGGEVPGVTEFTTETSQGLKGISDNLVKSDDALTKTAGLISAPFMGVASGVVTGAGAIPSAVVGAGKVVSGGVKGKEILDTAYNTGAGFVDYVKEGAVTNPLFTAGELGVITGGAGKGAKFISTKRETNLVRLAQGDIEASFAESVGVNGKSTKEAFMAAGDALKIAEKIDVPLKNEKSTGLKELSMFSDLSDAEAKAIDKVLADGNTVSYGTSSNVAYGLNFRKSSDYDASIPQSTAEATIKNLETILEPHGAKREGGGESWQITKPSPETGKQAHAFDLHRLDSDTAIGQFLDPNYGVAEAGASLSTSTFERIPGTVNQYKTISPDGSDGMIFIEPLKNAYSRKYAATFFPKTNEVANLKERALIPPKNIQYETKINPEIYTKDPFIPDLENPITKLIPIKGFAFTRARVKGTVQNIGEKIKNRSTKGTGPISQRINYPLELSDSHRMKDALDLVGITWEYQGHIIKDNVKNPVKKALYQRKIDKSLNTMLKDEIIRTQVKRGAASKLSELSPDFAKFLHQKEILTDGQLKAVQSSNSKNSKAAFTTGTPEIGRMTKDYLSISKASRETTSRLSPYNVGKQNGNYYPSSKPSPYNKPTSRPKPYNIKGGSGSYKTVGGSAYSMNANPRAYSEITPSPYNVGNYAISGNKPKPYTAKGLEIKQYRTIQVYDKKPRKTTSRKMKEDLFSFSAARTGRIDHLSIVDPLEMMGQGSMTNRNRADMTLNKNKLYFVDNAITNNKPTKRLSKITFE